MELRDYVRILRDRWRIVLASVLVCVGLAVAYVFTQPKVYTANASGFVTTGQTSNPTQAAVADSLAKSRAASYVDVATSRATASEASKSLHLKTSPDALIGKISVSQPKDTVLLKISANGSSPREAQRLADAWVRALAAQVQKIEKSGTDGLHVQPLESAQLPSAPSSPRPKVSVALGLLLGLVLGMVLATVRHQLDRRVKDRDQVRERFGVPVAGVIPETKQLSRGDRKRVPVVVGEDRAGDHVASEAVLKLRTNLAYMDVDNPPRVIVVTSPNPGDGKSTLASNLAAAIAANGDPTVLIDGDLRRPVLADGFDLAVGAGLTDVLARRAALDDVLQRSDVQPNLLLLGAGASPPNPSEILGSRAMQHLIERLRERFYVIIDAPPLLPVTDAAVLTTRADGALMVIRTGKTLDAQLDHALQNIEEVNGRVLGVVMNHSSVRAGGYYGSYYGRGRNGAESRP